ncbi:MAG: hypothetical protein DGJ47_000301 [Rickettsiaceae bacterium]
MEIKELTNDKTCYHAQVIIPSKKIEQEINAELAKVAKNAKMDGFRPGKVPTNILNKKYLPSIRAEVVKHEMDLAINKVVEDKKLNIAFEPEIEDLQNEDSKDLKFKLKFEIMPEITLPDFKKIEITKPVLTVDAKSVDDYIEKIASNSKDYTKEKKKAAKDDQVTIDATGYVDGKAFEGGALKDHKLVLGSGAFIPGFEDQLIDSKPGDDVTVKVDFPKDYHSKDLAGKPSEFEVKVIAVHGPVEAKINDDFAKKFNCKDLADMKKQVQETIERTYAEPIKTHMKMELFDKLEKEVNFDSPKTLMEKEIAALESQKEQMSDDPELKDLDEKGQKEYFTKMASRRVCIGLFLAEYVKNNKLTITEEDVREAILAQARNYPGQEQQVIEFYQKNKNAFDSIKGPILEEKAVKAIFDKEVTIKEKKLSKEQLEKLLNKKSK